MKNWKNKLVPMLFALASVGFLVRPVKQLIKEEPLDATYLVLGICNLVLAGVFLVIGVTVGRKSGGGPVA